MLHAARPQDGVLGEETGAQAGRSGVCWLVDPLDGTANFVSARSDYAVSVAGGSLRAGDRTLELSCPSLLGDALVTFGLPSALERRRLGLRLIGDLATSLRAVRVIGSAACDFLALLRGESDASCTVELAEWDTAAGRAMVVAAGGTWRRATTGDGLAVLVAGSPTVAGDLVALLEAPAHASTDQG